MSQSNREMREREELEALHRQIRSIDEARRDPIVVGASNIHYAVALAAAASRGRRAPIILTPEQQARRAAADERAAWNREVEAKKAAKRARAAQEGAERSALPQTTGDKK